MGWKRNVLFGFVGLQLLAGEETQVKFHPDHSQMRCLESIFSPSKWK
jgi:hypothetical protein